jgi:hypothetical protein
MPILLLVAAFAHEFRAEAARYGLALPTDSVTYVMADLSAEGAMGKSTLLAPGQWLVQLDSSYVAWYYERKPEAIKGLVWHELGHVYLGLPDVKGRDLMNPAWCDRFKPEMSMGLFGRLKN